MDWGSGEDTQTQSSSEKSSVAYHSDRNFYRMVAGSLGMVVVIAVTGAILLSLYDKTIPEALSALGSGAIGALAGVLAGNMQ